MLSRTKHELRLGLCPLLADAHFAYSQFLLPPKLFARIEGLFNLPVISFLFTVIFWTVHGMKMMIILKKSLIKIVVIFQNGVKLYYAAE